LQKSIRDGACCFSGQTRFNWQVKTSHVTICVLACLLLNTLEEKIANMSGVLRMGHVLDELEKCKINVLTVKIIQKPMLP